MDMIFPRSAREMMCGWVHLPRFIDKVRLHLAGKLHPDYQANFGKGFDGLWLEAAGVKAVTDLNRVVAGCRLDYSNLFVSSGDFLASGVDDRLIGNRQVVPLDRLPQVIFEHLPVGCVAAIRTRPLSGRWWRPSASMSSARRSLR